MSRAPSSADPSSLFAPGEWLYANYAHAVIHEYPTLAAAQAACAIDGLCVGVGAPLSADYLAGVAPAGASGAFTLGGTPLAGYAPTPVVYYAKLSASPAPATAFSPASPPTGWASADDSYACAGDTSFEGACVLPSRALGERACAADPNCKGYARPPPPPAANMETYFGSSMPDSGSAVGAVRLLGAPPAADPLAAVFASA